jgi:S-adenosylmethionine decarboxylase
VKLGTHILADFYGVSATLLRDCRALEALLEAAASAAGARILGSHFHSFGGRDGVTGVVLLSESHLSIHTWPEADFAAADIFMCGAADPQCALASLIAGLAPTGHRVTSAARGRREHDLLG